MARDTNKCQETQTYLPEVVGGRVGSQNLPSNHLHYLGFILEVKYSMVIKRMVSGARLTA
jgi:hypothetical protein